MDSHLDYLGPSIRERRLVVYTSSRCPKCTMLKGWLRSRKADFEERSLEDAEVMATLVMKNVFVLSAPALEIEGLIYGEEKIFNEDGKVRNNFLDFLEGKRE